MKTIYESDSTPAADGFFMPAEFAPQDRVWIGWPHRTDTWAHGAKPAQKQYAAIARAISQFTPVTMCANEADFANCLATFEDDDNVTVIEMTTNDAWFRDTGATFVTDGAGSKRAVDWHFNAYGGLIDGLYFPWDADDQIAAKMAQLTGCVREGIDPEETNGHIDDVATFIAPGVVAVIWTDDPDYPFYRQCHEAYETLSSATDAKGRQLKVHKLPMPVKPLYMDQASCDTIDVDENAEPRVADEPLIASYMNYLVTNGGVIVPQYGDENDALAVQTLQEIYDEVWGAGAYQCVGVQSEQVVFGGGNIHCITQQEPKA